MSQNQFLETYSKFLQKFLKPRKPLKAVFDCSDGVAGLVLKKIKSPLNSQFIILNSNPDGNFPAHGPNPSKPGATKQLQAAVKKHKADLGIIFDADGDRMLCVDDKGRFVDPEASARLLIWHLKPNKIIVDASTGWLVKRGIMNNELRIKNKKLLPVIHNSKFIIHESKVGQYFIKQKMRAENADFGAERSGHYYFRKFFGLDSGILAAIEVINAVSELPYKFSDFVDLLPKYFRKETEVSLKRIKPVLLLKKIEKKYLLLNTKYLIRTSHLDGLTMEFAPSPLEDCEANRFGEKLSSKGEGWWFNLRFSQTESLLRLNIEALTKSKVQKEYSKLKKFIK